MLRFFVFPGVWSEIVSWLEFLSFLLSHIIMLYILSLFRGAGDETLRFWQVFPGPRSHDKSSGNGLLFPSSPGSILR